MELEAQQLSEPHVQVPSMEPTVSAPEATVSRWGRELTREEQEREGQGFLGGCAGQC